MDRLALGHPKEVPIYLEMDIASSLDVHFNARLAVIPKRNMAKGIHWDRASKFPVDPVQQIEIERCRNALRIVIRRQQNARVLESIDTDEQH